MDRNKVRLIICGGSDFNNYPLMVKAVKTIIRRLNLSRESLEILSKETKGASRMGAVLAKRNRIALRTFSVDIEKYGEEDATLKSDLKMVNCADICLAFWDKESRETVNIVKEAKRKGIKILIVDYIPL